MTAPVVPVTGITPGYGLEYMVDGESAWHLLPKWKRLVDRLEAVLLADGQAPLGDSTAAGLLTRLNANEARTTPVSAPLTLNPGFATLNGYTRFGCYRSAGLTHLTGIVQTTAAVGAGAPLATLTAQFRPPLDEGRLVPLYVPAERAGVIAGVRLDINPTSGLIYSVNAQPINTYLFLHAVQFLHA